MQTLTRHHDHIDVTCRDCGTKFHSTRSKPMLAASEAEVNGWGSADRSNGRGYGMACPQHRSAER